MTRNLNFIWNHVHLVQGSTRWYVLVRASTYPTRYKAVRETSKWYIPIRTNIENSYGSTYWYVLVCTALYLHSTRWYKTHKQAKRNLFFPPSLHHKIFEFEMKFSEIFPDVFYFTTGNPRDFTSRTAQPKGDPCISSRRAAAQEWNKRMLTVIESIS